ncbi:hypothetical protein HR11_05195 [Porphyromonas macacae]|uniref:META domain-containing protein n=1 Tax=Porphyromonas macacae TaxID=28115 RepID=UPI00052D4364|nr:META domain-containing protein [Porphyromonas macacae]KGN99631.1 hypothetical protein HR11_05195 [Porphyromonas macacae]
MKSVNLLFVLCIAIFSFMGCNTSKAKDNKENKDNAVTQKAQQTLDMLSKQQTTWQVLSIKGDTVFKNMNTTLLMDPSENKFSGKAPCNIYGGILTIDENGGIKFSEVYSTLAACENIMQEQEYIARLQAVKSYLIKDDKLYFYDVERSDVSDSVSPIIEFAMPKK